jgi:hypothetical protein
VLPVALLTIAIVVSPIAIVVPPVAFLPLAVVVPRASSCHPSLWLVPDQDKWRQVCKNGIIKRKVKKK